MNLNTIYGFFVSWKRSVESFGRETKSCDLQFNDPLTLRLVKVIGSRASRDSNSLIFCWVNRNRITFFLITRWDDELVTSTIYRTHKLEVWCKRMMVTHLKRLQEMTVTVFLWKWCPLNNCTTHCHPHIKIETDELAKTLKLDAWLTWQTFSLLIFQLR